MCSSQNWALLRGMKLKFQWIRVLDLVFNPYAMTGKELERLKKEGIIEPIQFADWAAPIVAVLKADGKSVCICGDFKVTINQASKLDQYTIPKISSYVWLEESCLPNLT